MSEGHKTASFSPIPSCLILGLAFPARHIFLFCCEIDQVQTSRGNKFHVSSSKHFSQFAKKLKIGSVRRVGRRSNRRGYKDTAYLLLQGEELCHQPNLFLIIYIYLNFIQFIYYIVLMSLRSNLRSKMYLNPWPRCFFIFLIGEEFGPAYEV